MVIVVAAYVLPGVHVDGFFVALVVAVMLGVINAFVKPILTLLTLPITILTLGLFIFVINAFMIMLVAYLVPGFRVDGFFWALIFSIIISLMNAFLSRLK